MASNKQTKLLFFGLAPLILLAILGIGLTRAPRSEPGFSLIINAVQRNATKIQDTGQSYYIDGSGTAYRCDNTEMTYSIPEKDVYNQLMDAKHHLSVSYSTVPIDGRGPKGPMVAFEVTNDYESRGKQVLIFFDSQMYRSTHVSLHINSPISRPELLFARLTGKPVQDFRSKATTSAAPKSSSTP